MKTVLLALFSGALMANTAMADSGAEAPKKAVVYFSCTGHTQRLAQTAAKVLAADVIEIIPEQTYTSGDLNWHDPHSRSSIESHDPNSRPAIKNKIQLQAYDTVVVAYPIWWGYAPKILYTFVENSALSGKTIIPICTSGGSGLGSSARDLGQHAPQTRWLKGAEFRSNVSEAELQNFFSTLLK